MNEEEAHEQELEVSDGDPGEMETVSTYLDVSASSEQTAHMEAKETPSPASQRRLIPPNGKPPGRGKRHRRILAILEWLAIAAFFALSLYYIYLLFFSAATEVSWKTPVEAGRWRYIVLHHSATAGGTPEAFDKFHRETRGWENGLGYHFVIGNGSGMPDGQVVMSRRWREQLDGAHVTMAKEDKANSFCIGVALVGDFEKFSPTQAQMRSLDVLLSHLMTEYGISADRIVGHGQVSRNHTDCPGKLFPLPEVVKTLAAKNGNAGAAPTGG